MTHRIAIGIVFVLGVVASATRRPRTAPTLYKRNCAQCHDTGANRAPNREAFRPCPPSACWRPWKPASMVTMANNRTAAERRAIAEFLTGKSLSNAARAPTPAPQAMCQRAASGGFNPAAGPRWNGWGRNTTNTRFQDAAAAGLTAATCPD